MALLYVVKLSGFFKGFIRKAETDFPKLNAYG